MNEQERRLALNAASQAGNVDAYWEPKCRKLQEALHDIMMTETISPQCALAEFDSAQRDFYERQLKSCIGRAARALEGK